jgi:hypothetical protein
MSTHDNLIISALLLGLSAGVVCPAVGNASEQKATLVAARISAAPIGGLSLSRQIDFEGESQKAEEVQIRRHIDQPPVEEKIVRSPKKNIDKILILGGSAVIPM